MSASINFDENVEAGPSEDGGRMSLSEHLDELRHRLVGDAVLPRGTALPFGTNPAGDAADDRLIVSTAMEPFSLYLKVSLYGALSLSVPFLLLQVWGFISPCRTF